MTTSSIDELIRNHNPFAGHTVVRPQQIWGKSFPDVPSINAHVSNAIFQAVAQVRQGQRQTVGITITGEKGLGKSQIISRIRHGLQPDGSALFVYMGKYDNLNQIKYQFLQNVASSLRAFGSYQGVMQWQELAAALINEAKNFSYTPQQYISMFPSWLKKYPNQLVDRFTDWVIQIKPEINNPYLVKAILWTLSSDHAIYATHWLSGLELTDTRSEEMGLPNSQREHKEAEALTTVRQILDILSDYRVPVICFDELDNTDADDNGFTAAQVVASLAKDLYNNLKRGVLLLAMYPDTWRDQVKVLPKADAVIDRLGGKPIQLNFLNSDDVVVIVSYWLKEFYQEHQQTSPSPLYPFDENKLKELGKQRLTVRAVLNWCAEHFVVPEDISPTPTPPPPPQHPVEPAFNNELAGVEESLDNYLEDNDAIGNALRLGFSNLVGETVEEVKIAQVAVIQGKKCYLGFKIIGEEDGKTVKIGVAIVQYSGGSGVQAILGQLIDYEKFDLTRGCLVRSKKISPSATKAREFVRTLLNEKGGEWVLLRGEDIKPLLAIQLVLENRESYKLSEAEIIDFIKQKQLAINNPLIREILSDPSGQEPENLMDEDMPVSIPQGVLDSANQVNLGI
ncbi:hypothetical protein [Microcoleus sp.]|uniref:hypothetical protein n=1 Tax=Microcoleus sp. TaxID=44472 RepID=UPI003525C4C0